MTDKAAELQEAALELEFRNVAEEGTCAASSLLLRSASLHLILSLSPLLHFPPNIACIT